MEVQDYYMSMNICREVEKKKCFPCVQFCLLSSLFGSGERGAELLISL